VDAQSVGLLAGSRSRISERPIGVAELRTIRGAWMGGRRRPSGNSRPECPLCLVGASVRTERTHGDERNGEQSNGSRCDGRNDLVVDRRRLVGCRRDRGVA